jgi:hypothetical protein
MEGFQAFREHVYIIVWSLNERFSGDVIRHWFFRRAAASTFSGKDME